MRRHRYLCRRLFTLLSWITWLISSALYTILFPKVLSGAAHLTLLCGDRRFLFHCHVKAGSILSRRNLALVMIFVSVFVLFTFVFTFTFMFFFFSYGVFGSAH